MVIFLYVAFLFVTLYSVVKVLLPELRKSSSLKSPSGSNSLGVNQPHEPNNKVTKLETLLDEKIKVISLLKEN